MATLYAIAAGGNWDTVGTWSDTSSGGSSSGTVPTSSTDVVFDSGSVGAVVVNQTTCVCKTLTFQDADNIITFSTSKKLTVSGDVTFFTGQSTNISGAGTLEINAVATLTSAGNTIPGGFTFNKAGTDPDMGGTAAVLTLVGNAIVTGLFTIASGSDYCELDWTTNETLTCNGGITCSAWMCLGTAKIIAGGGTIQSGSDVCPISNMLDLAGDITVGSVLCFDGSQMDDNTGITYVSGLITTTSSTLYIRCNCFLDTPTADMHWNNLHFMNYGDVDLKDDTTIDGDLVTENTTTFKTSDIYIAGDLTVGIMGGTGSFAGNRTIIMEGSGTWTARSLSSVDCNLTFDATGETIVVSGVVCFGTKTLTYTAGTITTTSSRLSIQSSCTLDTDGVSWNDISLISASTVTLSSDLTCTGKLSISTQGTTEFAGAFDIDCGTLYMAPDGAIGAASVLSLVAGQTLTVSTAMYVTSTMYDNVLYSNTIQSSTESDTNLAFAGAAADCKIFNTIFTYVDASTSAQGIDNWYGGTLSNTTNITNRTSADIGGSSNNVFGIIA